LRKRYSGMHQAEGIFMANREDVEADIRKIGAELWGIKPEDVPPDVVGTYVDAVEEYERRTGKKYAPSADKFIALMRDDTALAELIKKHLIPIPQLGCPDYDWEKGEPKSTCWLLQDEAVRTGAPCDRGYDCPYDS